MPLQANAIPIYKPPGPEREEIGFNFKAKKPQVSRQKKTAGFKAKNPRVSFPWGFWHEKMLQHGRTPQSAPHPEPDRPTAPTAVPM
jgi:hypothetical protein